MRVLAIDYGAKRVGLAVGETDSELVLPAGKLEREDDDSLAKVVAEKVSAEQIGLVVVGEPLGMSGKPTEQTKRASGFVDCLRKHVSVPVELSDERLTSKEADRALGQNTHSRDELSAMRLLETYLLRRK